MDKTVYLEMHKNEDKHWWFVARRKILKKILDCFFEKKASKNVLEVGCGTGGNLEFLSSYGILKAIELDDQARDLANSRNFCEVKKVALPENIPFEENFDLICLLDVLEHIEDDFETLKTISNKLNPGGNLLLTVPAFKFLWSGHDVVSHHKRRYTKNKLIKLLEKAEFKIIYATYFDTFLFPVIVLVRFLNNFLGQKEKTDIKMPSKNINVLLQKIFASESFFLPKFAFPFGVSILIFVQKND